MSRGVLRGGLQRAGVPVNGDPRDGETATIVEFVEWWGVLPAVHDDGALDAALAEILGRVPDNANGYRLVAR